MQFVCDEYGDCGGLDANVVSPTRLEMEYEEFNVFDGVEGVGRNE